MTLQTTKLKLSREIETDGFKDGKRSLPFEIRLLTLNDNRQIAMDRILSLVLTNVVISSVRKVYACGRSEIEKFNNIHKGKTLTKQHL